MENLIRELLKILCPRLKAMAANTSNPVDDVVVNVICMIADTEATKEE